MKTIRSRHSIGRHKSLNLRLESSQRLVEHDFPPVL